VGQHSPSKFQTYIILEIQPMEMCFKIYKTEKYSLLALWSTYNQLHFKFLWNHKSKMHSGQVLKYSKSNVTQIYSLMINTFSYAELEEN